MEQERTSWCHRMKCTPAMGVIGGLFAWDLTWKLIALWKAARRRRLDWYLPLALINSVGVLPMIYIFAVSPHQPEVGSVEEEAEIEVEEY
jgi:hypothetical protein